MIPRTRRTTLFPYTTLFRSIHELAKELGLENKEMIALLKERKIIAADVKSPSSTVDKINASALREEFSAKLKASGARSEEHTSELQSRRDLVCRLLLEKKKP